MLFFSNKRIRNLLLRLRLVAYSPRTHRRVRMRLCRFLQHKFSLVTEKSPFRGSGSLARIWAAVQCELGVKGPNGEVHFGGYDLGSGAETRLIPAEPRRTPHH